MVSATFTIEKDPTLRLPFQARLAPPEILRIDRQVVKPGTERAVHNLQKQVALALTRWGNLHPCLSLESLTGPKEVWHLSGFHSSAEQREVTSQLKQNEELLRVLSRLDNQMRVLTDIPSTVAARYRPGSERGRTWHMGHGHYLVVSVSHREIAGEGTLYETPDGMRFLFGAARTRKDAERRAALTSPRSQILVIRPSWGMPAFDWTRSDPEFWMSSPLLKSTFRRAVNA